MAFRGVTAFFSPIYSTFEDGEVHSNINLSYLFIKVIKICTSLTPKLL